MRVGAPRPVTLLSTNVPEDDAPPYDEAIEYATDAIVMVLATHRLYQALRTTAGEYPPDNLADDDPAWSDLSATNARACVDEFVGTQTVHPELIDITIDASRCDALALFGVEGRTLTLDLAVGETVIFSRTYQVLQPVYTVTDYFFSDARFTRNYFVPLLVRAQSTLRIRVNAGVDGTAKLGNIVPVLSASLGDTEWGVEIGFLSYSKKNTDTFGRTSLKKGANSNTVKFTAEIESSMISYVNGTLSSLDGIAALYVAHNENGFEPEALITYGFFNEFSITIPGPILSTVEFTVICII
ncbi:hypothetical protein JCM15519_38790 [Fundidesulfovibrio butyratiphilus]